MQRGVLSFLIVLGGLTLYGRDLAPRIPWLTSILVTQVAQPVPPGSGDWYLSVDQNQYDWDHGIFYTGFGSAVANARESDVLILGTSRTQLGLSPEIVREFCRQRNIRFYSLAMGHAESSVFPLEVIRRQNLRPKFLLVGLDVSDDLPFFSGEPSDFGRTILNDGPWVQTRTVYSGIWLRELRYPLEQVFPYALARGVPQVYRSWNSGFWMRPWFAMAEHGAQDVAPGTTTYSAERRDTEARRAKVFVDEMRSRGTTVIFALLPIPGQDPQRARDVATRAGVPLIAPELSGLGTFDGSHLDIDSARRYTTATLEALRPILLQDWPGGRIESRPALCGPGEIPPGMADPETLFPRPPS